MFTIIKKQLDLMIYYNFICDSLEFDIINVVHTVEFIAR